MGTFGQKGISNFKVNNINKVLGPVMNSIVMNGPHGSLQIFCPSLKPLSSSLTSSVSFRFLT